MTSAPKKLWLVALASSASIIGLSSTAQAQTAAAPSQAATDAAPAAQDASSQDIVVTATRRSERLQDVPMSVNVVTGDKLQKLNIFDTRISSSFPRG